MYNIYIYECICFQRTFKSKVECTPQTFSVSHDTLPQKPSQSFFPNCETDSVFFQVLALLDCRCFSAIFLYLGFFISRWPRPFPTECWVGVGGAAWPFLVWDEKKNQRNFSWYKISSDILAKFKGCKNIVELWCIFLRKLALLYIYISAVTQELFDFFSSARKETYCVSPLKLGILVIWFCQHFGEKPSNSNRSYLHLIPAVLKGWHYGLDKVSLFQVIDVLQRVGFSISYRLESKTTPISLLETKSFGEEKDNDLSFLSGLNMASH